VERILLVLSSGRFVELVNPAKGGVAAENLRADRVVKMDIQLVDGKEKHVHSTTLRFAPG
jgi:hypothetical protein